MGNKLAETIRETVLNQIVLIWLNHIRTKTQENISLVKAQDLYQIPGVQYYLVPTKYWTLREKIEEFVSLEEN